MHTQDTAWQHACLPFATDTHAHKMSECPLPSSMPLPSHRQTRQQDINHSTYRSIPDPGLLPHLSSPTPLGHLQMFFLTTIGFRNQVHNWELLFITFPQSLRRNECYRHCFRQMSETNLACDIGHVFPIPMCCTSNADPHQSHALSPHASDLKLKLLLLLI